MEESFVMATSIVLTVFVLLFIKVYNDIQIKVRESIRINNKYFNIKGAPHNKKTYRRR